MFSLFKGRYGVAERDFNPFVVSNISTTPQPLAAPLWKRSTGANIWWIKNPPPLRGPPPFKKEDSNLSFWSPRVGINFQKKSTLRTECWTYSIFLLIILQSKPTEFFHIYPTLSINSCKTFQFHFTHFLIFSKFPFPCQSLPQISLL